MTFPKTLTSIKLLIAAEILSMANEVLTIIVALFAITAFNMNIFTQDLSIPVIIMAALITLLLLSCKIGCYVLYLISVRKASAEDANFKVAFYSAIICVFLAVSISFFSFNKEVTSIAELLIILTELLTQVYILEGLRSLSIQLGHPEMDKLGGVIYAVITTIFVIQTFGSVSILVLGGTMASVGASSLSVMESVLSIFASILFTYYFLRALKIFSRE